MLRPEQNKFATETGPGTPMGELFRRYWIPVMHAEELPENECPPVRVKLLSERLLAWRDTQGRLALTDEFCAHRGVSLWFGRNEQNGLRCPYHGWKYDHTGQCIEVPSEPAESGFCQKIKLKSYPLIERGGILWAYMGPPELQPPFPEFEWAMLPAVALLQLQALAGVQLSAGDGRRHRFQPRLVPAQRRHAPRSAAREHQGRALSERPEAEVRDRGIARRAVHRARAATPRRDITTGASPSGSCPGTRWCRPTATTRSTRTPGCRSTTRTASPGPSPIIRRGRCRDMELDVMRKGGGIHVPLIPGTFRPIINKDNDYLIDRAAQKRGETYCGVKGIAMQDAAVQESMGPIQDRSQGEPGLDRQRHHHGAAPPAAGGARLAEGRRAARA